MVYMLAKLGYIDGKCYHDHGIHTDPMGYGIMIYSKHVYIFTRNDQILRMGKLMIHREIWGCNKFLSARPEGPSS